MDNILDHVVVQGQSYDIVSPTAFGDYIETIGSACINPDGYAQGSTFLAKFGNEQFYYEATAAITQGSAISEGTNCKRTTVTGREAELALEIENLGETVDSLNEALTNEVSARQYAGAVNFLKNIAGNQVVNEVTYTVNSNKSVTATFSSVPAASRNLQIHGAFTIDKPMKLSGCPSGGGDGIYRIYARDSLGTTYYRDDGNGVILPAGSYLDINIVVGSNVSASASPITFYPMLTEVDYTGPYVPYAMTNRELTDNVVVKNVTITPKPGVTISYNGSHKIGNLAILNFVFLLDASFLIANDAPIVTIDTPPLDNAILVPSAMLWDGEVGGLLGIMKTNNIIKLATSSHFVAGKSYTVNATYVCA